MTILEAIEMRHSVRRYLPRPLEEDTVARLREEIDLCNREGGLHIQLICGEREAFQGPLAHYGHFSGVENYLALIGPKGSQARIGWYGERLALLAQTLGLNTCWVALTMRKHVVKQHCCFEAGEKLQCVMALGYGATQGAERPTKPLEQLCARPEGPDWFIRGVRAAQKAPTAVNQQKFFFTLNEDGTVSARAGRGTLTQMDLGIAKYHFEVAAGSGNFRWREE